MASDLIISLYKAMKCEWKYHVTFLSGSFKTVVLDRGYSFSLDPEIKSTLSRTVIDPSWT